MQHQNNGEQTSLNWAAVEDLKRYREEVKSAHPGEVFEDSVELLRQAREERTRELEQKGELNWVRSLSDFSQ
jgi:hypothetical protein